MSERVLESFEVDTPRARREFPCCGDRRRRFVLHKRRPTMCMDPDYEIAECLSCGATLTTGDNAGQEEMARLRVAWERSCGEWTLKRWPVVSQDGEELTP